MLSKDKNFSSFKAHFERRESTSFSKLYTETDPNTLAYELILTKYFDLETVSCDQRIPEDHAGAPEPDSGRS